MFFYVEFKANAPFGAGSEFDNPPDVYSADLDTVFGLEKQFGQGLLTFTQKTTSHEALELEVNKVFFDIYANKIRGLAPMTTLGDMIYGDTDGEPTRLAGHTTPSTKKWLSQTANAFSTPAAPAWSTIASSDIPIVGSGANQVVYQNSTPALASSPKFKFDGSDATLDNPTAATGGAQTQPSPYLYMMGNQWDTDAAANYQVGVRSRMSGQDGYGGNSPNPGLYFDSYPCNGNGWTEFFSIRSRPGADYLTTRVRFGNPIAGTSWGGFMDVWYNGTFEFKDISGNPGSIKAQHFGDFAGYADGFWQGIATYGSYSPEIRTNFSAPIIFAAGNPLWFSASQPGISGGEHVRSEIPMLIQPGWTSGTPAAPLHIIKTTEQQRWGYDGSTYAKITVGSTGQTVFDAFGSGPTFAFNDQVTIAGAGGLTINEGLNINISDGSGSCIGDSDSVIGIWGATPVAQSVGWSNDNFTPRKTFDRDTDTLGEFMDYVQTYIEDTGLSFGLIGS